MRNHQRQRTRHGCGNTSREQFHHAGRGAFELHHGETYLRHVGEKLHRQMWQYAVARAGIQHVVGPCAREGDEFFQRLRWQGRVYHQQNGHVERLRDRGKVAHRVVRQFLVTGDIGGEGARCRQQCVAVGRSLRHDFRANNGACARAQIDDHLAPPTLGEFLTNQSRGGVAGAAGRSRHDNADRAVGVSVLGEYVHGRYQPARTGNGSCCKETSHATTRPLRQQEPRRAWRVWTHRR